MPPKKAHLLYPDFTVGTGITPVRLIVANQFVDYTTGRELHPAPEDESCLCFTSTIISLLRIKSNRFFQCFTLFCFLPTFQYKEDG